MALANSASAYWAKRVSNVVSTPGAVKSRSDNCCGQDTDGTLTSPSVHSALEYDTRGASQAWKVHRARKCFLSRWHSACRD
jgi:hypothetical protein